MCNHNKPSSAFIFTIIHRTSFQPAVVRAADFGSTGQLLVFARDPIAYGDDRMRSFAYGDCHRQCEASSSVVHHQQTRLPHRHRFRKAQKECSHNLSRLLMNFLIIHTVLLTAPRPRRCFKMLRSDGWPTVARVVACGSGGYDRPAVSVQTNIHPTANPTLRTDTVNTPRTAPLYGEACRRQHPDYRARQPSFECSQSFFTL